MGHVLIHVIASYMEIHVMKFELLEIFSMDLYRILAGDDGTAQYKLNLESSEFNSSGLHCIIIIIITQ